MHRNFFVQLGRFLRGSLSFILAILITFFSHFLSTPFALAESGTKKESGRQEYLSAEAVPPRSKILEAIRSASSKFGDDPLYLEKIQTVGKALVFDWNSIQSVPSQITKSGKRTAIKVYCGTNALLGLPCVIDEEGKVIQTTSQVVQSTSTQSQPIVVTQTINNSSIDLNEITDSIKDIVGSVASSTLAPVYNVFNTYCTTNITNSTSTNTTCTSFSSGGSSSGGGTTSGDGDYTGGIIVTNPVSTAPSTYDQASAFVPRRLYAGPGISLSGSAGLITIGNTGILSLPQDLAPTSTPTFARVNAGGISVGSDTITDFTGTGLEVVDGRLNVTIKSSSSGGGSSGSNSDANTLDGLAPGDFLRSNTSDSYSSGILCFDSGTTLRMCAGSTLEVLGNVIGLSGGSGSGTSSAYFTVGTSASTTCGTFAVVGDSFMCGGLKILAPTTNAISVGNSNTVTGLSSIVYGSGNDASGNCTYAFGRSNTVSGSDSLALGYSNVASLCGSTAIGFDNTASGQSSFAGGYSSTASGSYGLALGYCTFATGATSSSAVGNKLCATGSGASVFGGDGSGFLVNNTDNSTLIGPRQGSAIHILSSGEVLLPYVTATSTTATSTLPKLYVNELIVTGGAQVGCLTGDASVNFSTTTPTLSVGTTTSTSSAVLMVDGATCITSSNGAVVLGDTFGNSRGIGALDIQSFRDGVAANVASGICAIAVGNKNEASNIGSIAFGSDNISSGIASVSVGHVNTSSGTGASAFGVFTCADSTNSSAFGNEVCALAEGASIFGGSGANVFANTCAYSTMIGPCPGATIHILCTGETKLPYLTTTDSATSTFAGPVTFSGDVCVMGNAFIPSLIGAGNAGTSSAYFTVGTTTATPPSGSCLYVLGGLSLGCYGTGAVLLGDTSGNTRGTSSLDIQSGRTSSSQVASGRCAIAIGYANTASGNYSSAFGIRTSATANCASVFGGGLGTTTNSTAGSTMIGPCQGSTIHILSTGEVRLPYITATTTNTSCIPTLRVDDLCVTNAADIANLLVSNFTATTTPYLSVGTTTLPPSGSVLFVDGGLNVRNSNGSVLLGDTSSTTRGNYAIDFQTLRSSSTGCIASGACSVAIGNNVGAFAPYETNIGACNDTDQNIYGRGKVTIGYNNKNLGHGYDSGGYGSIVVGSFNCSAATYPYPPGVVFGISNTISGYNSIAVGYKNTTCSSRQIAFGVSNRVCAGIGSIAIGCNNQICAGSTHGQFIVGATSSILSSAEGSVSLGVSNVINSSGSSLTIGRCNCATANSSYIVGYKNNTSGSKNYAVVLGAYSTSTGNSASAVGNDSDATGDCSNAFGYLNCATAGNAQAFGKQNTATCQFATAFGLNNISCATSATAFGDQNSIFGCESSAFGRYNCIQNTTCFGSAFGYCNILNAPYTSGFGYRTCANASGASVFGGGGNSSSTAFLINDTASSTLIGPTQGSTIHILSTGEVRLPYLTGTSTASSTLAGALGIGVSNPSANLEISTTNTGDILKSVNTTHGSCFTYNVDSAGRSWLTAYGDYSGVGGGAYFTANGKQEAWFNVIARSNTAGQQYMRFGNLSDKFSVQLLNDAGSAIVSTPFSIENTAPDNSLYVDSTGYVGIGSTSPSHCLTVAGDINYTGTLYNNGVALGSGSGTVNSGNTGQVAYYGADGTAVSGTSTLFISGENVGIGTTTPAEKFVVSNSANNYTGFNVVHDSNGGGNYLFAVTSGTHPQPGAFGFYDNNAAAYRMIITSSGNVSIGANYTVTPASKLAVYGNSTIGSTYATVAAPTDGLLVEGKVGIGTTSPSHCLTVAGDINYTGTLYQNGVAVGSGSGTVNSGNTGQVAYYASDGSVVSGTSTLTLGYSTSTLSSNLVITGNFLPSADNTYSLGASTTAWKDVFVGPGSLYINGKKVLEESGGEIVVSADPDQTLTLKTSGDGDVDINPSGTGQVLLKGNVRLNSGYAFNMSDNSAIPFTGGVKADNITIKSNLICANNLNGGISLHATGTGGVYVETGKFGVGTTSPSHCLTVAGDINYTGTLYQNGVAVGSGSGTVNSGNTGQVAYYAGNGTAVSGTSTLFISGENVGIGTTNPSYKLDICGDLGTGGGKGIHVQNTNSNGYSELVFDNNVTEVSGGFVFGYGGTATANPDQAYFWNRKNAALLYGTNGLERMRITGGGNVGVGTTSPSHLLTVAGDINYTGTLYQNGVEVGVGGGSGTVNSGTAGQVAYYAGNGTAVSGTSTMTFENNRVKIGTGSTCCAALNIFSSNATGCSALSLTAGQTNLGGGGNQIIFGYNCTNACTNHAIKTRHDTTSAGGNSIDFYTWKYGTDALTDVGTCHVLSLTGCGYVGIGITNPTLPLQLPSTVGAKIGLYGCTYGLGIGNNLVQLYAAGTGDRVGIGYGGSASFTEVLTVAGSGKVGIGCTSPGQKLTVAGDIGLSGILCFATTSKIISVGNTNTNSGNYSIAIGNSTCACGTCAVSVGNVSKAMSNNSLAFGLCTCASAIGASVFGGDGTALFANTTTCSTMIGPRNTAAIQICANGSASVVQFHGYGAGTPELLADGVLSVSSDERLKDIQGNFDRGLDEIMQLDPIIYSWKKETPFYGNGEEYAGFSAQDVEEVIPEAVAEDSRGYLSLNTKPIIATLVNAMKEIGQYFVDGTLRIGRIVSDVIEGQVVKTKKLETEEICVDDVCIDKESLKALLIEAGARNNTEEEDTSSGGGSTTEEVVDTSTSTEEIIDDTATSTDSGVSEEDVSNDPSGEGSVEDTSTSTEGESGAGETLEEEPEPEPDPEPEPAPEEPVADTPSE